jgi:hypothetical protein
MTESADGRRPVIREVFPYLCVPDPFGHEWLLGYELEALSSEEIKRRSDAEQGA